MVGGTLTSGEDSDQPLNINAILKVGGSGVGDPSLGRG